MFLLKEEIKFLQGIMLFIFKDNIQNIFFVVASNHKVNFFNSKLGGVRVNDNKLNVFTVILNFTIIYVPFTYLG